ncbi:MULTISPECIES: cytochrome c [unclassified Hyphomicrobium]|uniref:c-type cytochrome n=1 Tax=unclassified Hyphomicrobium TaxID=2619925 RepID=UPI000213DB36|nr:MULTISPECIES: c-type cytochrome [unclassified Hyphomicrobium]CCB66959.1 putative cytochrome c [Hyphomicrobium sp. MC1]
MRQAVIGLGLLVAAISTGSHSAFADDIADKIQLCAGCHGENGVPQQKTTPVIWGQNQGYLYIQLRDFKRGARKNDQMSAIAEGLSKDDMKALAAHFSGLKWPSIQQPSPSKDVTKHALTVIGSIGCTSCHLDQYQGDSTTPRLAGQQAAYLLKTMTDFRDHSRANNPGMSDLMNAAQPADLDPIAQYLASLTVIGGGGQ